MTKVSIVTQVRNESSRIPEWADYHKRIGIDEIFIYDDNSVDSTIPTITSCGLTLLKGSTDGLYIDSSNPNEYSTEVNSSFRDRLKANYTLGCRKSVELGFDWTLVIDVDEFLCLGDYESIHDYLKIIKNKNYNINRLEIPSYDFNTKIIDNNSDKLTEKFLHRWSEDTRRSQGFPNRCKSMIRKLNRNVLCPHLLDVSPCLDVGSDLKLFQYRFPPLSDEGFVEKDEYMLNFWKRQGRS